MCIFAHSACSLNNLQKRSKWKIKWNKICLKWIASPWYLSPARNCFIYLSFIFSVYVDYLRGFSLVFHTYISYFYQINCSIVYFSIALLSYYSAAFSALYYALFIHRCNVFQYYFFSMYQIEIK
jgi:hypothetical protein